VLCEEYVYRNIVAKTIMRPEKVFVSTKNDSECAKNFYSEAGRGVVRVGTYR
jgi:hypothetical protein